MGYDDDLVRDNKERRSMTFMPLVIIFGILFFPGAIIAFILYSIFFRSLRWKPSMLFGVFLITAFVNFLVYFVVKPGFSLDVKELITLYLYINMWASSVGYLFISFYSVMELKNNPELKYMKGWAYEFEYERTPFEKLKDKKLRESCREGKEYSEEGGPLGVVEDKVFVKTNKKEEYIDKPAVVVKYYTESLTHSLCTGATGSGKTVTLLNQILNDILTGKPSIFIDCKNSIDTVYFLSKFAKENGREFYHFGAGPQSIYSNPYNKYKSTYDALSSGSPDYKSELLLNLRTYDTSSAVYKDRAKTVLSTVTWLLDKANPKEVPQVPWHEGGIAQVAQALKADVLYALIVSVKNDRLARGLTDYQGTKSIEAAENLYQSITKSRDEEGLAQQVLGYRSTLNNLMLSSYGEWLVSSNSKRTIDLSKIIGNPDGPIVLFSLSTLESPDISKAMGSIILGNISQIADNLNRQGVDVQTTLYIDEFQTMNVPSILGILEKARSAKISTNLSLQSLEQIPSAGYPTEMIDSILDTCSNFIIHAGSGKDTAERFSKIVGTYQKAVISTNTNMDSSLFSLNWKNSRSSRIATKYEDDWKISPKEIQNLEKPAVENGFKSTAFYITKSCDDPMYVKNIGVLARKFQSIAIKEITDGVPKDFIREYNKGALMNQSSLKPTPQRKTANSSAQKYVKREVLPEQRNVPTQKKRPSQQTTNTIKTPQKKQTLREKQAQADIQNREKKKPIQRKMSAYEEAAISRLGKEEPKKTNGLPDLNNL